MTDDGFSSDDNDDDGLEREQLMDDEAEDEDENDEDDEDDENDEEDVKKKKDEKNEKNKKEDEEAKEGKEKKLTNSASSFLRNLKRVDTDGQMNEHSDEEEGEVNNESKYNITEDENQSSLSENHIDSQLGNDKKSSMLRMSVSR